MEGFQIPIHRSLTQPILLGGSPREFAIINGTVTAAIVIGMQTLWGIPIGFAIQALGAMLAKHDPQFLETFKRHLHIKPFYEV